MVRHVDDEVGGGVKRSVVAVAAAIDLGVGRECEQRYERAGEE